MKRTKTKIAVSAFTLLIGAALAGSVSGTIAWYQYSTSVYGAYVGTAGGTSGNLQMRIKGSEEWGTRLTYNEVATYLANTPEKYGSDIQPITSGAMEKDGALPADFYANPRAGFGPYSKWIKASEKNFVRIPLELRYIERDGVYANIGDEQNPNLVDEQEISKNVYLSDLLIKENSRNGEKGDLSSAIRFHIHSYEGRMEAVLDDQNQPVLDANDQPTYEEKVVAGSEINRLVSKNGGTIMVQGKLDIDGDGKADKGYVGEDKYGFDDDNEPFDLIYGKDFAQPLDPADPYKDVEDMAQTAYHARNGEYDVITEGSEKIYPAVAQENERDLDLSKTSYERSYIDDKGTADESDDEVITEDVSKSIGKTIAKDPTDAAVKDNYLNVVVTIWVEGWQELKVGEQPRVDDQNQPVIDDETGLQIVDDIYSSIWNSDYINAKFDVGFQFSIDTVEE